MTEKNDKKLLLIKAAVYADFRSLCVSFKPEKLNNFKIQLQKCAQLGLIFEHLNKWTRSQEDIVNFRILDVILQSDIRTKEKNSEKYQAFFANAGELFQELKPYSDAYYEVKTKNLKLNKLGFYFTTGNQVAPKTVAVKTNQEHIEEKKPQGVQNTSSQNEDLLLKVRAAIYKYFIKVRFEGFELDSFKSRLKKCVKFGIVFKYLNEWNGDKKDINKIIELSNILWKDIQQKNLSENYQAFFENENDFIKELKPYADAYFEVKTKGLTLNPLGKYLTRNNKSAHKNAAAKNRAKSKPKTPTAQNLKDAVIKFNDFTEFSADSTELNIYIDEAWPGCQNSKYEDTGVIAGIVWLGRDTDDSKLPQVRTHIKEVSSKLNALQHLLDCENAMPFIFPLKNEAGMNSGKDYFTIFEAAVKILLGWILPQRGKNCNVRIYPEHINNFVDGTDKTEYFHGVLNQAGETTGRFSRFNIEKVEWQAKEFGYIPYGDLLGYLTVPTAKGFVFQGKTNYKDFTGYLPISIGLFELLSRLDIIEETKNVEDIYNLIDRIYGTKIYNFIMSDLKNRLENNVELKTKILESIEAKYLDKNRDLRKLRLYFREIMPFIESEEESANTVIKLLFTSIRLQNANHDGNPAKIEKYLADYDEKRAKAIQLREFEIAADCELHLAVHYNDMFQFDKALDTLSRNEFYFDSLKLPTLGKFYSSLGQNKSIKKDFDEAKRWFNKALEEFNKSEDRGKALEIEQTSVYRLFNALEGNDPEYPKMFTGFFGTSPEIAARFAKENSVADQYKHHLLVRSLFSRNDLGEFKAAYLAEKESWDFLPQHPWQLIEFYRAMLLNDEADSFKHLENALAICENEEHGGIIYLIGAVISAAGATKFSGDKKEFLQKKALEFVEKAENMRVIAKETAMLREKIKENCGIENILEILPFNYR